MARRLGLVIVFLTSCAVDDAPLPGDELQFLRDPASGMCTPIEADSAATPSAPWAGWDACADPCAALDEPACSADRRCAPSYDPASRGYAGCDPVAVDGACLGLGEAACGATAGCQPVYAGEPCVCPDDPSFASCACPAMGEYRGCAAVPPPPAPDGCAGLDERACHAAWGCDPVYGGVPCECDDPSGACACPAIAVYQGCQRVLAGVCSGSAECPMGSHCSTEDGDCRPPAGCDDPAMACPAVCAGVCVPGPRIPSCFEARDEESCLGRGECEPVYVGQDCACDAGGCRCRTYTYESCRDRSVVCPAVLPSPVGSWRDGDGDGGIVDRTYHFEEGGAFKVVDEIAPCPPGAACVWEGIVVNGGRWEQRGETVVLGYGEPVQRWDGLRFPTELSVTACPERELVEIETGRAFRPQTP
jgi:hypothetical protein